MVNDVSFLYEGLQNALEDKLLGLPDRYRAVGHPEVGGDGLLATNATLGLGLGSVHTGEDANLQHTGNLLDRLGEDVHLPDAALAAAILSAFDIRLGEQVGGERRIYDEEAVVRLQGAVLAGGLVADLGIHGAQSFQSRENTVNREGGDLDGDVFPGSQKTGLELAGVYVPCP